MPGTSAPALPLPPPACKRGKVTDISQLIVVSAVESVCCAREHTALTFATPTGLVRVIVPTESFIEVARAERDSNARPYPAAAAKVRAALAEQAPVGRVARRCRLTPEREVAYRDAWRRYIADARLRIKDLAAGAGITPIALGLHFARFRAEPGAPVLKPNGRLH